MAVIKLRVPDSAEPLVLPLQDDVTLLIGRAPDVERLPAALQEELRGSPVQLVEVPSLRVSANHLLVRHADALARVWDLHSRNGTWLRLVPMYPVALPGQVALTF